MNDTEIPSRGTHASATRLALGRPVLHVVVGALFALLFTWPLLSFDSPLHTWSFIYGAWACSVPVLFFLSRGRDGDDGHPQDTDDARDADH